jgi:hypothetical protein
MQNAIMLVLTLMSAATSLVSAAYWLRSARVPVVPAWLEAGNAEPADGSSGHFWTVAQLKAGQEVARLNAIAASWMVPSALLVGAVALVGAVRS